MALILTFPLADPLRAALDKMRDNLSTIRAVIVTVESEVLVLKGEPFEATLSLDADLAKVREFITKEALSCCFVLVKLDEKKFNQVMFVADGTKPKVKMQYASSAAHLRESSRFAIPTDIHIVAVDEINAALFGRDVAAERPEMMTEKEKLVEEISKMEVATQKPQGMPGVATPLDDAALTALQAFRQGDVQALSFTVHAKGISVDGTMKKEDKHEEWVKLIPEAQPRFVLIHWGAEAGEGPAKDVVLVYICPAGCKPKDRMPYASTKASFVAQVGHQEIKLRKSVETDDASSAEATVKEALTAPQLEEDVKPIAPKSVMPKGPRMLMA